MHAYDILMLAVLIGATWFGARKGLAWQIASIASLVFSYLAALRFADQVAPMINAQPPWNRFGAMLVIYLGVSLGVWMVFRLVANFIDQVRLRDFDRHVGAVVGLAKGVLLCLVITFFAITLWTGARDAILQSKSGYYIAVLLNKADAVMPPELHDVLSPYLHKLENELDPNRPPGSSRPPQNNNGQGFPSTPRTANANPWPPRFDGPVTDGYRDPNGGRSNGAGGTSIPFVSPVFPPSSPGNGRPSQPESSDGLAPLQPIRRAVEQGIQQGIEDGINGLVPLRPRENRDPNSGSDRYR